MKCLWIGTCLPKDEFERLVHLGYSQSAAQRTETSIINGIANIIDETNIRIIGATVLNPWPKSRILIINKYSWNGGVSEGYINIPLISHAIKVCNLKRDVIKWARVNQEQECAVITYGLHSPYLVAAKALKKKFPNMHICCIVPDLPEFMDMSSGKLKQFLKAIDRRIIHRSLIRYDSFVLFSQMMRDKLPLDRKPFIVMEGVANTDDLNMVKLVEEKDGVKIVLYTGSLRTGYGIDTLLSSLEYLDERYELWIAGRGSYESQIKKMAAADSRIKYLGYITNRLELLNKMAEADVLAVMLPSSDLRTNYCFPSKIFDYLLVGKPIISYRLGGIPNEYYDGIIVEIKEETPKAVANAIREACSLDVTTRNELQAKQTALLTKKSSNIQAKRIMRMIQNDIK